MASPSTYPCHDVSQWVSEWVSGSLIVSDWRAFRACSIFNIQRRGLHVMQTEGSGSSTDYPPSSPHFHTCPLPFRNCPSFHQNRPTCTGRSFHCQLKWNPGRNIFDHFIDRLGSTAAAVAGFSLCSNLTLAKFHQSVSSCLTSFALLWFLLSGCF